MLCAFSLFKKTHCNIMKLSKKNQEEIFLVCCDETFHTCLDGTFKKYTIYEGKNN